MPKNPQIWVQVQFVKNMDPVSLDKMDLGKNAHTMLK